MSSNMVSFILLLNITKIRIIDKNAWSISHMLPIGSMVKWLRHRPFTAVTGVQIPLESLWLPGDKIPKHISICGDLAKW